MDNRLSALYALEGRRLLEQPHTRTGDYAHPVFGEGDISSRVMLLGEAPGAQEALCGHPFVGKAGKQLDGLLDKAGITREAVFVTNAVKFRPTLEKTHTISNRTPVRSEIEDGLTLLKAEIGIVSPKVIATLGNTPLFAALSLAGLSAVSVGSVHGKGLAAKIGGREYLLFALYHPASVIYNPSLLPVLEEDLCLLGELCKREGII